ncbi:unnamed protein product [Brassica oleracea var. botrytis]|uniref:(rape) hypothetical protein n=1 Tax=Brassica napus TaxID=3708 RepID=A0A816J7B3_BRANA|nr:unnamed protein product [Brassica napus]
MAVKLEEEKEDTVADVNPPATINTEICFGNLPYNFDSARLAQIIQDFANAELVKDFEGELYRETKTKQRASVS